MILPSGPARASRKLMPQIPLDSPDAGFETDLPSYSLHLLRLPVRRISMMRLSRRFQAPMLILPLAGALAALLSFTLPLLGECDAPFRRGDVQGDGKRNVTDALKIFGFLFLGDEAPACLDAAD